MQMTDIETSEHAKALSTVGAAKGGKARAEALTEEERKQIARKAAETRWGSADVPKAIYTGDVVIAERRIICAVLDNKTRLINQGSFLTAIGRAERAPGGTGSARLAGENGDGLPPFLAAENLAPFVSDKLRELAKPILFRNAKGLRSYGYNALLLPSVCEVYLKARDAGEIKRQDQKRIVGVCDLLMRGFAQVGITALVDAATGYEKEREKDELSQILAAYINEELRPWVRTFPAEFFKQIYRLQGWEYTGSASRPSYVGKRINELIYDQLPPGVLDELRQRNPVTDSGYRRHKHHQFLTEGTGIEHLDKQIDHVTMLMRVSDSKEEFERLFKRAFNKHYQLPLPQLPPPTDDNKAK